MKQLIEEKQRIGAHVYTVIDPQNWTLVAVTMCTKFGRRQNLPNLTENWKVVGEVCAMANEVLKGTKYD